MDGSGYPAGGGQTRKVTVRDLPTRLFHWLIVALVIFQLVSGKAGWLDWHMRSGETVLALVLFRILWGIAGSRHARLGALISGPRAVGLHVRELLAVLWRGAAGASGKTLGHSPLGGWMVLLLLLSLLIQTGTGLFATDEIATDGPLNHLVSGHAGEVLTKIHHINFAILVLLVAIHIAAALFYLWRKRENLIAPLITGRRDLPPDASPPDPGIRGSLRAAALLIVAALVVWGIVSL